MDVVHPKLPDVEPAPNNNGLPVCDGANGISGVDCVSSEHFPRKYSGHPNTPAGPPVLAF